MILNIVKNNLDSSCIAEYIKSVFNTSEVNIKKDYGMSVDIEVAGENKLFSLEGLKELEHHIDDYDIRIW